MFFPKVLEHSSKEPTQNTYSCKILKKQILAKKPFFFNQHNNFSFQATLTTDFDMVFHMTPPSLSKTILAWKKRFVILMGLLCVIRHYGTFTTFKKSEFCFKNGFFLVSSSGERGLYVYILINI